MTDLAQQVAAGKPDAIIAIGNVSLIAAKEASATIPVVAFGPDLVELGYADSLARPGGNLTGIVILSIELNAKRLELLHAAIPAARRIAVLMHPLNPLNEVNRRATSEVATRAGIELLFFEAAQREDYRSVVEAMRAAGADALAINADPQFAREGDQLAALAQEHGLPTICQWREMAEQGCFLSYGPSLSELYRRLADFAGRILRGATPREMPIERPSRFEFVVNAKTGKALSRSLPASLLARADEVIE
jgi:putative ABC transport system substrate-binding protein